MIVIKLDNIETGMDYSYQNEIQNDLVDLYKDLEAAKDIHANLNLAKMVVINDIKRVKLLLEGKLEEAEDAAKENYKPSKSKEEKANCDSEICLIYPIDEEKWLG